MSLELNPLAEIPIEMLAAEIERRKKAAAASLPLRRSPPDFQRLIECINLGERDLLEKKYQDDDFDHYVYEAAMDAIYVDYWGWRHSLPFGK